MKKPPSENKGAMTNENINEKLTTKQILRKI
jgi:hypothetical protein